MFPHSISPGAPMAVRLRFLVASLLLVPGVLAGQRTQKPALHGRHWVAITGKPLAATAGAMMFQKGGNPVDAACAMLAAVTTMWDVLSWGGETQALIYNPRTKKVIAINALGVAPTGATPDLYRSKGMHFPPEYGPLAAITPGTPGGLMTLQDLATWKVKIEEPVMTTYRGIDVYKLQPWSQGPAMLQALNILENFDLKAMGYNSTRYIHTLYQTMSLAFADRDFYYGDPAFPPDEPIRGLLSKEYARERAKLINPDHNDPDIKPGDPYPFQGGTNPYLPLLQRWSPRPVTTPETGTEDAAALAAFDEAFRRGTTSIEAADSAGWVVSVTPSGGRIAAVFAGHQGIGVSQHVQA